MAKNAAAPAVQALFIQKLKEVLPPSIGLADELSDVLSISADSAYRRIRGETDLSIHEVFTLAKKHGISVDSVFSQHSDTVTFTYTKLIDSAANFEHYLTRLYNHLKTIHTFEQKRIFYVAEELPIFFSFFSKKLTEFKLFYWQRSVLNVPDYQGKKFEYGIIPKEQIRIAQSILEEYRAIPSTEIWTDDTIFTVTKQVEYYFDSGAFSSKDVAIDLLEEIRQMAQYVQRCAETTQKTKEQEHGSYALYSSDVVLGTNCIYIQTGESNYAYVSFNTLNSLTTSNREFCEETEHWIKTIERKSTLISGVAEKQRFRFFSQVQKHIDAAISRIQSA